MKLVIQRVKKAKVEVENNIVGQIENGFMVLLGIAPNDTEVEADYLAKKLVNLRVFEDNNEKMNLSLKDIKGKLLIISQFTLYANCKSGNRPSFIEAAKPEKAEKLYEYFCNICNKEVPVEKGIFGANMEVIIQNSGPVTIILEKENMEKISQ